MNWLSILLRMLRAVQFTVLTVVFTFFIGQKVSVSCLFSSSTGAFNAEKSAVECIMMLIVTELPQA